MKILLEQHGGLAAAIRRPTNIVDSDALPESAAAELAKLVAAAKAAPAVPEAHPGRARDAMSYTITVEEEGQPIVLNQSDTDMSPAFSMLLAWLARNSTGDRSQGA